MQKRYYSLDVFRGATVALMILVNNPGTWTHMFAPLQHAPWHGCTPTDLVFPFFLFAVGNAMSFVIPRLQEGQMDIFWKKIVKRTVLIFLIGLGLSWFPFVAWKDGVLVFREWVDSDDPTRGVRIFGVLQRIAVAYFFSSILCFYLKPKTLVFLSVVMLFAYWAGCIFWGGGDPYSLAGWFGTDVDTYILGVAHLYKGEGVPFDPEGIASTLPAIVQVIFGYLVGVYIRHQGQVDWLWARIPASKESHFKLVAGLMITGFLLIILGWIWSLGFPINKKIWSSSYVLYTSGLATMTIGGMIWFTDVQGVRNGVTKFFDVFGKNPLFIFVLSGLLPKAAALLPTDPLHWFYEYVCARVPGPPEVGSFVYSLCFLLFLWGIVYWMDRRKIYVKV